MYTCFVAILKFFKLFFKDAEMRLLFKGAPIEEICHLQRKVSHRGLTGQSPRLQLLQYFREMGQLLFKSADDCLPHEGLDLRTVKGVAGIDRALF